MENTILFESSPAFSVPCDLVDRHLNAPETELRLMLLLLRNANAAFLKEDLMRTLNVDEPRLKEAFQYWVKAGLLYKAAGKYTLQRPQVKTSDFMTYQPETIAQRLEGDYYNVMGLPVCRLALILGDIAPELMEDFQ